MRLIHSSTESREDYLETIFLLTKEKGACRSIDVAAALGYSKASVSRAVATLCRDHLLQVDEAHLLHLTADGEAIALRVFQRHQILRDLLLRIGVDPETAEREACRMEHVISDALLFLRRKSKQKEF